MMVFIDGVRCFKRFWKQDWLFFSIVIFVFVILPLARFPK
jgi:hypothetical protein